MLNQAFSDRAKLSKLLNISDEQMSYVTNADAGCGLIKYGSALVPPRRSNSVPTRKAGKDKLLSLSLPDSAPSRVVSRQVLLCLRAFLFVPCKSKRFVP